MFVHHFKNHSPTPQKYVHLKFANGGSTQLIPLEIVGERAQLLAMFARVECTPGRTCADSSTRLSWEKNTRTVGTIGISALAVKRPVVEKIHNQNSFVFNSKPVIPI